MKPRTVMFFVVLVVATMLSACAGGRVVVVPVPVAQGEVSVAQAQSVFPTPTATPELDGYNSGVLRSAYYAEVDRREAQNDIVVKGDGYDARYLGLTEGKDMVLHVAHVSLLAPDGSAISIPWVHGNENIVRMTNLVSDTVVIVANNAPATGYTVWEYPPNVEPDTLVQALWPIHNPGHCGLSEGCAQTREIYVVWDGKTLQVIKANEFWYNSQTQLVELRDLETSQFFASSVQFRSVEGEVTPAEVVVPVEASSPTTGPRPGSELESSKFVTVDGDTMTMVPPEGYEFFLTTDNATAASFATEEDSYAIPMDRPTRIVLLSTEKVVATGITPAHVWTVAVYGGVSDQKIEQLKADQSSGGFTVIVVKVVDGIFVLQ